MEWLDTLDNNTFLKTLFPGGSPSLDVTRLHEVVLQQDGASVALRFDLNEYPAEPPAKWQAAKANKVQVRVLGIGVREMAVLGWASKNVGRLVFKKSGASLFVVEFDAESCKISTTVERLRVDMVSAYRNEASIAE